MPIFRGNRKHMLDQINYAKKKLESGIILWVAPEGTRSSDGELGKLKRGGFKIAQQMDAIIVPLRITGSDKLYSPDSKRYYVGKTNRCLHSRSHSSQ